MNDRLNRQMKLVNKHCLKLDTMLQHMSMPSEEWVENVDSSVRLRTIIRYSFSGTPVLDITDEEFLMAKYSGKKALKEFKSLRGY